MVVAGSCEGLSSNPGSWVCKDCLHRQVTRKVGRLRHTSPPPIRPFAVSSRVKRPSPWEGCRCPACPQPPPPPPPRGGGPGAVPECVHTSIVYCTVHIRTDGRMALTASRNAGPHLVLWDPRTGRRPLGSYSRTRGVCSDKKLLSCPAQSAWRQFIVHRHRDNWFTCVPVV